MKIDGYVRSALALALIVLLAPAAGAAEKWVFTTHAGVGPGASDGVGRAARFYSPFGLALDPQGRLLITDYYNFTIRRATPSASVSTIAGRVGVEGEDLGPVSVATFSSPRDIVVDKAGNIFVADTLNRVIRKITTGGEVVAFVGTANVAGSDDGQGAAARFQWPGALAIDKDDNIYVADEWDSTIRKITPAGVVTTLAGKAGEWGYVDATGSDARFDGPTGIAVDGSGNVYVSDVYNNVIRKITPAAVVTTLAGSPREFGFDDGTGSAARFAVPLGLAVDPSGNLVVADYMRVRRVTPDGVVSTLAGTRWEVGNTDGTGSEARFQMVLDVAVDAQGNAYVTDEPNDTIRRIAPDGTVTTFAGVASAGFDDGGPGTARFAFPEAIKNLGEGHLLVADKRNHTLRLVYPNGDVVTVAGKPGVAGSDDGSLADARFIEPAGVALSPTGDVFISDQGNSTIRKIDTSGTVTTFAGAPTERGDADGTGSEARFRQPAGIVVDGERNVFVADRESHTIRKITPEGVVTTFAGTAGSSGTADGTGAQARFDSPAQLSIDGSGNLLVADSGNKSIRKVTPQGVVTTFAGKTGEYGYANGPAADARFDDPEGICVDGSGDVFVTDAGAKDIRKIDQAQQVSSIGGKAYEMGWRDGVGDAARFDGPSSIDIDPKGILFIADPYTNTIRRGVLCEEGALCTLDGRFQLTLVARNVRDGATAPGVPIQQNDLFGYFSLPGLTFNEGNPEVFVKMLDGRPVNGQFWVFYGGLTDFEYTLTVKDKLEGTVKSYTKAGGTSNGGFDVGGGVAPEACNSNGSSVVLDPVAPAPCSVEDDNLCLSGGRFKLELEARDPRTGATGLGVSIPQGDLFGYFALPDLTGNPSNPEVFVKMLDGRAVNGKFWIFYSGLTDLEYTMTVTDTETGARKRYTKAGGSACGAFDTNAF